MYHLIRLMLMIVFALALSVIAEMAVIWLPWSLVPLGIAVAVARKKNGVSDDPGVELLVLAEGNGKSRDGWCKTRIHPRACCGGRGKLVTASH